MCRVVQETRSMYNVSILTQKIKYDFMHACSSVVFTKFAVQVPPYQGRLHTRLHLRYKPSKSYLFSSFFLLFLTITLFLEKKNAIKH